MTDVEELLTRQMVADRLGKPCSLVRYVVVTLGVPLVRAGNRYFISPSSLDVIRAGIEDYESKLPPKRGPGRPAGRKKTPAS